MLDFLLKKRQIKVSVAILKKIIKILMSIYIFYIYGMLSFNQALY